MVNNRTRDEWVDLFLTQFLMEPKNLPYTIQIRKCPENNDQCQKHHQEAVVEKYYEEDNNFLVCFFKPHQYHGEFAKKEQKDLKYLLLEGIRFRVFNTFDLKEKLELSSILMTEVLQTRVTLKEKEVIENIAKRKKMTVSEYLRTQALHLTSPTL
jgi:hypothetical protein